MFALDECRVGLSGCVLSGFEVPDLFCWDTIDIMKQWSHIVNALRPPIPSDGSVIRRVSLDRWVDPSPLSWAMRGLLSSAMTKYDNLIQFIYQVILLFYIVWWRQISHSNLFYLQYSKLPSALCVCVPSFQYLFPYMSYVLISWERLETIFTVCLLILLFIQFLSFSPNHQFHHHYHTLHFLYPRYVYTVCIQYTSKIELELDTPRVGLRPFEPHRHPPAQYAAQYLYKRPTCHPRFGQTPWTALSSIVFNELQHASSICLTAQLLVTIVNLLRLLTSIISGQLLSVAHFFNTPRISWTPANQGDNWRHSITVCANPERVHFGSSFRKTFRN